MIKISSRSKRRIIVVWRWSGNRKLETTSCSYACRENALIHSSTRLLSITLSLWVDKHRHSLSFLLHLSFSQRECFPVFVHVQYFFFFSLSVSLSPFSSSSSFSSLTYYHSRRSTDNELLNHFVVHQHSNGTWDKKQEKEYDREISICLEMIRKGYVYVCLTRLTSV